MDKTEMSLSDGKEAPNEPVSMQSDTENPDIVSKELVTPNESQASCAMKTPKLKPFCEDRKENLDNCEVENKDHSLSEKTIQKLSEIKIDDYDSGFCLKTDSNEGDKKPLSESGAQSLEGPMDTATVPANRYSKTSASESASKDLKHFTKAAKESAMTPTSEKVVSEVSVNRTGNSEVPIKTTRGIKRQRIVYDEIKEYNRAHILQTIKDRQTIMKFKIMKGKYSNDLETKMDCIEMAKKLQDEIDEYFDLLEDFGKMEMSPKRFKGNSKSSEADLWYTERKTKKKSRLPEPEINSCSSLFLQMYKSSSYEYKNENVFKMINREKFICAWNAYLVSKKKQDGDNQLSEYCAKTAVEDLFSWLVHLRSRVKCKIAPPENRCLADYQNYINDLIIAVKENLDSLETLLPLITSVIFPLFSYLTQSRKKVAQIFSFLNEERPDIFCKKIPKEAQAFFENFCKQHFKIDF